VQKSTAIIVYLVFESKVCLARIAFPLLGTGSLWYNDINLRKFQNWHHPKNHEYDGEINKT